MFSNIFGNGKGNRNVTELPLRPRCRACGWKLITVPHHHYSNYDNKTNRLVSDYALEWLMSTRFGNARFGPYDESCHIIDYNDGRHPLSLEHAFNTSDRRLELWCDVSIQVSIFMIRDPFSSDKYLIIGSHEYSEIAYTRLGVQNQFGHFNYFSRNSRKSMHGHMQVKFIQDATTIFSVCSTQHVGYQLVNHLSISLTPSQFQQINAIFVTIFRNSNPYFPKELIVMVLSFVSGPYIDDVDQYAANTWLSSYSDDDIAKIVKTHNDDPLDLFGL